MVIKMNFKELVEISCKEIKEDTIISYPEIKDLCYRPYPNHKKGCPNDEKCKFLNVPDFETIKKYGKYNRYYLIYAKFDFKKYKELRKEKHPDWTEEQLGNIWHWQKSVKKLLSEHINNLNLSKKDYILGCGYGFKSKHQERIGSMENSCINVFSTMKLNGTKMEIKPRSKIYLCCLIASLNGLKTRKTIDQFV